MIKKTLVIGASTKPNRYAYVALQRLVEKKEDIRAIGKKEGIVKGVKIHTEKRMFKNVDTVNLYLNKTNQEEFYDYILKLKPRRVIFNPGTENEEFEKILSSNNIAFERSCTLVLLSIGQY
ncbi:CoA-binding protein [Lutibacter sp.]|uniref:CoA-binding protein n=1 Tax=Lutibacter sp. TaxID=1925666 RepID=UPI002735A1C0|nr:CoA-binding protein [Lutibacter sp.]MDP3312209.1 CoA-binding protein [Lutibacter sp.]